MSDLSDLGWPLTTMLSPWQTQPGLLLTKHCLRIKEMYHTDKGGNIFPSITHSSQFSAYVFRRLKFPWQSSEHLPRAQTVTLHSASSRESSYIPLRKLFKQAFPSRGACSISKRHWSAFLRKGRHLPNPPA